MTLERFKLWLEVVRIGFDLACAVADRKKGQGVSAMPKVKCKKCKGSGQGRKRNKCGRCKGSGEYDAPEPPAAVAPAPGGRR